MTASAEGGVLDATTINIPASTKFRDRADAFHLAADHSPIFGINECFTAAQRNHYRLLAERLGLDHYGLDSPNPVFWNRSRYSLVYGRVIRLHGPAEGWRARRWSGFNAERFMTVAILLDRETGDMITVICTHLVPRGVKVNRQWREEMRAISVAKIAAVVSRQRRAGRFVLVLGDVNMKKAPRIWGITWLRETGVDVVGVGLPRGYRIRSRGSRKFSARIDHGAGVRGWARYVLAA